VIVRLAIDSSFPLSSVVVVHTRTLRRQLPKGWQVKFSKVAAVVAGSVMAVGAGAPAFADSSSATPTSLDSGVNQLLSKQPLQQAVDNTEIGSALDPVTKAAGHLRNQAGTGELLGQATGALQGVAPALLRGLPAASLLGGLPLAR
jgi:hypothetical protein